MGNLYRIDYESLGGGDIEVGVEKVVGTITINGTKYTRYVKIVDCGEAPSTLTGDNMYRKDVAHGINAIGILSVQGFAQNSTSLYFGGNSIPFATGTAAGASKWMNIFIVGSIIKIDASDDWHIDYPKIYTFIEYYK